jgi:hypothetical protein
MARQHSNGINSAVLASSAFGLGVVTGLLMRDFGKQLFERARGAWWHREYERTITYDENLPESLSRREPAPYSGQPRFGGTGALGVSPATVPTAQEAAHKREGA